MSKRLTDNQKKEIINEFTNGKSIDDLADKFGYTKLTIIRNLKKDVGEEKYNILIKRSKSDKSNLFISEESEGKSLKKQSKNIKSINSSREFRDQFQQNQENGFDSDPVFIEIAPVDYEIKDENQKDLSSIPISEINFPKIVYMVVDKNIELEVKFLRDYPDWEFLSQGELDRKTIQIYFDLKIAKRSCSKEQKVLKVPNTDVFRIASHILVSRGISRIVSPDNLIAL